MKLGIGTAQFGMQYGIANRGGMVKGTEIAGILSFARQNGIDIIDTAALYGRSEEAIGAALAPTDGFRIVTKTPHFPGPAATPREAALLRETFARSLACLGRERLYALLAHNADDLLKPGGELLWAELCRLKREGSVEKVGASVYTGTQIDRLLERYPVDLVQLPINIFDQRLLAGGELRRLKAAGVEIHARSAFLQGLLLLSPGELPPQVAHAAEQLRRLRDFLHEQQVEPVQASLWFLAGIEEIDCVVCGVDTLDQLGELARVAAAAQPLPGLERFALGDESILNPSLWHKPTSEQR